MLTRGGGWRGERPWDGGAGAHTTHLQELIQVYDFLWQETVEELLRLWVTLQGWGISEDAPEVSEKEDWKGPCKSLTPILTNKETEATRSEGTCPSWEVAEPSLGLWGHSFSPPHQKKGEEAAEWREY